MQPSTELIKWLTSLNYNDYLKPITGDAGVRKYFRLYPAGQESLIVMDASADVASCKPFIKVAHMWRSESLNVPQIVAQDLAQGFLLLTDMGEQSYLDVLRQAEFDDHIPKDLNKIEEVFTASFRFLHKLQCIKRPKGLPRFTGDVIDSELDLFIEWFVGKHLKISLDEQQQKIWRKTKKLLINNMNSQTHVVMHRDFMSRNLLLDSAGNLGVIDFQDAMIGPVCYDVVSLLRDAFFSMPFMYEAWLINRFYTKAKESYLSCEPNLDFFLRCYFFTGLQRHLKVLGVFARLKYRDGKEHYLEDAPRFFNYITDACSRYQQLQPFGQIFHQICKL